MRPFIALVILLAACGSSPAPAPPPKKAVSPTEALLDYYAFCVARFHDEGGRWPKALLELYVKPEGMFTWKGPYLDGSPPPKDDRGNEVIYETDGRGFVLRSAGADGIPGNGDDVILQRPVR